MIVLVDPVYNPNNQGQITSATKLGPGVTLPNSLVPMETGHRSIMWYPTLPDNKLPDTCISKQKQCVLSMAILRTSMMFV